MVDVAFSAGSIVAAIAQGLVLGGFIQGLTMEGGVFVGGPLDWLTPFSLLVAASLRGWLCAARRRVDRVQDAGRVSSGRAHG
jgi:cytochrome bd-type quinol oxidase subunit 2